MKKQSMTQGTTAHKSALKMKAKQDAAMKMKREAAMKMKQEAAMKMKSPMELGKVGEFLKNTAQGKGVAGALVNPIGAIANKFSGGGNEAQAATQQAQQQMQQPAPTMMKKESPTKIMKDIKEGVKYAGKKLKNVKQGASDIKEGFRQLFTGDRTDSRLKKKSPSKLRKPTGRKNMLLDTTEGTPKIKRGPESTKRGRGLKPMTKEQRAKAAKEGMSPAEIKKALSKRGKTAPTKLRKPLKTQRSLAKKSAAETKASTAKRKAAGEGFKKETLGAKVGKTAPTKKKTTGGYYSDMDYEQMAKDAARLKKAHEKLMAKQGLRKAGSSVKGVKKSPGKFNAKLKAASAAGKLSGKFKEAVDASPAKMKKATKAERAEMAKGDKKMTPKIREAMKSRTKNLGKK